MSEFWIFRSQRVYKINVGKWLIPGETFLCTRSRHYTVGKNCYGTREDAVAVARNFFTQRIAALQKRLEALA